ncbi:F510_1955 family glycosylhydrolase [Blastococcus sp. SYSU DS0539]
MSALPQALPVVAGARRRRGGPPVLLAAALLLTACAPGTSESAATSSMSAPAPASVAVSHVHGAGIDPADGSLFLATHEGLLQVTAGGEVTLVSPVMDLMGFTVAGAGHFVASGHPGPDVDLPQPMGLIESTDGGRTWSPVSRQGESDFHALTTSAAGVLGYDGTLVRSSDGRTWEQLAIPAEPHTLTASPDGQLVLATTARGLLRSTDAGRTWAPVAGAPLLQVVDWAGAGTDVAGVDPSGVVWTSSDAGVTWQQGAGLGSAPQAVTLAGTDVGGSRIVVATGRALVESVDGGLTFDVVVEW